MTHSFPTRRSSDRDGPTAQWMLRMDCDPLYLPQVTVLQDGRVVASSRRSDARAVSVATGAALAVGQRFPIDIPPGESRVVLLRVTAIGFSALVADILPRAAWTDWAARRQAIVLFTLAKKIGRASCRERLWPYVSISVVAGYLKKKK